jgi:hypothetical protein
MTKARSMQPGSPGPGPLTRTRAKAGKLSREDPAREPRAPMQVLRSTKQWLDQIIDEKKFRTYDEAIMFLIMERQKHLPSDFGVFSDLPEYVCDGED